MLNIPASITSAENAADQKPCVQVIASDELLHFSLFTQQNNANLETRVPQSYVSRVLGTYAYAAFRLIDGTTRLQVFTLAGTTGWGLNGGAQVNSASVSCMRMGLYNASGSGATWLYTAISSGGGIQVQRQEIDAIIADPPTISLSNFGPVFGPALLDSTSKVVRVEAVCPSDGGVIVLVGTHDFTNTRSTIQFYWLTADGLNAYLLDAMIQVPLTDTYTTWYGFAQWATFACCDYNASTGKLIVIANGQPSGQPMQFILYHGIESTIKPLLSFDPQTSTAGFWPASVVQLGQAPGMTHHLLCGRYNDGAGSEFDVYLTSIDGEQWSFGESNFVLHQYDSAGTLLIDNTANPTVAYYGGNAIVSSADLTPAFGYNTASLQATYYPLPNWTRTLNANAPDSCQFSFADPNGTLQAGNRFSYHSRLQVQEGQWGVYTPVGVYGPDLSAEQIIAGGIQYLQVTGRDLANRALLQELPISIDLQSRKSLITALANTNGLIVKTRSIDCYTLEPSAETPNLSLYDHVFGSSGLQSKALNNPLVALADLPASEDYWMGATVTFPDTGDAYELASLSFLWSVTDDSKTDGSATQFLSMVIPKTGSWNAQTKPAFMVSNLSPYESKKSTGGWQFSSRLQGWWKSNNYISTDATAKYYQAVLAPAITHYVTQATFSQAAGTTYDYRLRRVNSRIQLYGRLHDYTPSNCASSPWQLLVEYKFTDDLLSQQTQRNRIGLAVNTDVLALNNGYGLSARLETQLSTAAEGASPTSGLTQWDAGAHETGAAGYYYGHIHLNTNGLTFNNYEVIALSGQAGDGTQQFTNQLVQVVSFDPGTNTLHWRSTYLQFNDAVHGQYHSIGAGLMVRAIGTDWGGWADSGYKSNAIDNSASLQQINPIAAKGTKLSSGRAAFVTDDATALSIRYVESDGTHHALISGNATQQRAWDSGVGNDNNSTWPGLNSNKFASSWRLILRPNLLYAGWLSTDLGINTSGWMIVDQEIVRRIENSFAQPGHGNSAVTKWSIVPTYYSSLARQASGLAALTQLNLGAGVLGDNWSSISETSVVGLLAEITAKQGIPSTLSTTDAYHVTSVVGATLALDNALNIAIRQRGDYGQDTGDFSILSGRAQLGTTLADHKSTSPICHYPASLTTTSAVDSFVTVTRYEARTGLHLSVEEVLKQLFHLAGVRNLTFRNAMTASYVNTSWTAALTTTPQTIPTVSLLSDFVLELDAYIPSTARLCIDFRNYYRLTLQETTAGNLDLGLITLSTDVLPDINGDRWLQHISALNHVGHIQSCTSTSVTDHIKLTVIGNEIEVVLNGQHLWTFDLSEMWNDALTSYYVLDAGPIQVSHSVLQAGNTATARVPELSMDCEPVQAQPGTQISSLIRRLCDRYGIRIRAIPGSNGLGGLEAGLFLVRDDTGTVTRGLPVMNTHKQDTTQVITHAMVVGGTKQTLLGSYIDIANAQAKGYTHHLTNTRELGSSAEAVTEAQLISRESLEFSLQEEVEGLSKIADQPEDRKTLTYAGAQSSMPRYGPLNCVITSIDQRGTREKGADLIRATYHLRLYQPWGGGASNTGDLLLESGSYLLLESGDRILLEG